MSSRKSKEWNRLDNAAKLFPHISNKRDTKVFRFSCQLTEEVDSEVLQQALDASIEFYPIFRSVIKHGFFWYYLERSAIRPMVQEENRPPCSPLYDSNSKSLLFEVSYYNNRINVEVFHALTDGTGALQFLRTLTAHYIAMKHPKQFPEGAPALDYDASVSQKNEDSFQKYYIPRAKLQRTQKDKAYRVRGAVLPEGRMKIIEGIMPTKEVLALARGHNTTLTIFLASILLISIHKEMAVRHRKSPVILSVPVNLRNYFTSETARNFFGVVYVGYDFSKGSPEFEDVIAHVAKSFEKELTPQSLSQRMSVMTAMEHNYAARALPLALKDIILRIAGGFIRSSATSSFSNIGKIAMPAQLEPYIENFDVFVSTDKIQACLCSYKDKLTVSFSSAFVSGDIQKNFFRSLAEQGVEITIVANTVDEE